MTPASPTRGDGTRRRGARRSPAAAASLNLQHHPDAAGIDVGASELYVAVPADRDSQCVRCFSTFTSGLHALRDWLLQCRITSVALESTGNYWINVYLVLEEAGLEVCLANARHVKGVPGKKTDVCDAQWLQQLHAAGLLRKSFRPSLDVAAVRYLMRHRASLVADQSKLVQQMQKVLVEMNLFVHHVFSDLDGQSALRVIEAIVAGERDAGKLADLRDRRCRTPRAKILEALRGHYRDELIFVLGQCHQRHAGLSEQLAKTDELITELLTAVQTPARPQESKSAGEGCAKKTKRLGNASKRPWQIPIAEEAKRFYEVDLTQVPGVGAGLLATLMSEIGPREKLLESFPTPQRFASWMGLNPDNRISGGKVLAAKTRAVVNRVAAAFRLSAYALGRGRDRWSEYARRMKGRLGKAEGIVAVAHKLARVVHALIKGRCAYDEQTAFAETPAGQARRLKSLSRQASKLGLQLVPATA